MGFDDLFDQRQPQPGPFDVLVDRVIHPVEFIKKFPEVFFGDADAGIRDFDGGRAGVMADPDGDRPFFRREFDGVTDEVDKDPLRLVFVQGQRRDTLADVGFPLEIFFLHLRREEITRGLDDRGDIAFFHFHFHPAGFDARDVQQVVDHLHQIIRVRVDLFQALLDRVGDDQVYDITIDATGIYLS